MRFLLQRLSYIIDLHIYIAIISDNILMSLSHVIIIFQTTSTKCLLSLTFFIVTSARVDR